VEILFFNPDTNLVYDGSTPDRRGFGGGKTAVVRVATALAELGHTVEVACNCGRPSQVAGVSYTPWQDFGEARRRRRRLTVLVTTADLDLTVFQPHRRDGRRVVWLHGVSPVKGLREVEPHRLAAVSRFVADTFSSRDHLPASLISVVQNGYWPPNFAGEWPPRDLYSLAFTSHWAKGLAAAVEIQQRLAAADSRFRLDVYGGPELWGGTAGEGKIEAPGVTYHGLVDQRQLARRLMSHGFLLGISSIPEAAPLSNIDAMAAGCVVITNNIGGIPEYVTDGDDGVVLEGGPGDSGFVDVAVAAVAGLAADPVRFARLSGAARQRPRPWSETAVDLVACGLSLR
jgi:glycosyltransferase involved in cell wall biosynthesis